ncbi:FAS1 domain [Macleaya cordata]|uniref:FAS1 domain n=1 Tax=Macleaya cordata TaxID=56857 RepID=A0A200R8G6_MACCD|nr:FAS1 domain [Macleaya cordata]
MNSQSATSSLLFVSLFLLISSSTAFNITKLLAFYDPEYSTFNGYLTETQLAADINKRQTITVLAVPNSAMSQLSGKSKDVIRDVISLHVVLDYFDLPKLQKLSKKTALLTTLFQSSGIADGQQGFLNVTELSSGQFAFGSAVKGSSLNANLVKSVAAQPYNISVLQVSSLIIPTGIGNSPPSPPPPPSAAPAHSPSVAPAPSKSKKAPTPSPSKAPVASPPKSAKAPAPSSDAPAADAPSPSSDADAPVSSPPSPGPAEGPIADAPAADNKDDTPAPAPKNSSGARLSFGMFVAVFMVVVSSWAAMI